MNYEEVIRFIFNSLPMYQRIGPAAYKTGLDNTIILDKYFSSPHKNFKTIHIAGTNGKGSVSHSLASVLQEAGYKAGLYTSPHLIDYRERIRVNGQMITKKYVQNFINENVGIISEIRPSFFEMSVALAFDYFRSCNVDIAVIETGLGGRLDSTNIINPVLTIITNIDYDHTQFLGNSLDKIAGEKAGIIKSNTPCIIGETHSETENVFIQKAIEVSAPIIFADKHISTHLESFNNQSGNYTITNNSKISTLEFALTGRYQQKNLATIIQSLETLQSLRIKIPDESIKRGLKEVKSNTGLRGRWEILKQEPLTICDTGHNKAGIEYVVRQLAEQNKKKMHLIIGFVADKDVSDILNLFPSNARYYFTQASVSRAMPVSQLYTVATKHNLKGTCYSDVISAYNSARENADKDDLIFIGGSTFVVADLLSNI